MPERRLDSITLSLPSTQYGLQCDTVKETDLHIHFPAGAIGKDGPSAGVAIAVALCSLYAARCVRSDTAMTGELTLRGLVLPVRLWDAALVVCVCVYVCV